MHTDSAAIAMANAEMLISSKLYPKHAVIITPAGCSIVSVNRKQIKIEIAFFVRITLLFPKHLVSTLRIVKYPILDFGEIQSSLQSL